METRGVGITEQPKTCVSDGRIPVSQIVLITLILQIAEMFNCCVTAQGASQYGGGHVMYA